MKFTRYHKWTHTNNISRFQGYSSFNKDTHLLPISLLEKFNHLKQVLDPLEPTGFQLSDLSLFLMIFFSDLWLSLILIIFLLHPPLLLLSLLFFLRHPFLDHLHLYFSTLPSSSKQELTEVNINKSNYPFSSLTTMLLRLKEGIKRKWGIKFFSLHLFPPQPTSGSINLMGYLQWFPV